MCRTRFAQSKSYEKIQQCSDPPEHQVKSCPQGYCPGFISNSVSPPMIPRQDKHKVQERLQVQTRLQVQNDIPPGICCTSRITRRQNISGIESTITLLKDSHRERRSLACRTHLVHARFCVVYKLRIGFTFLKSYRWRESKRGKYM